MIRTTTAIVVFCIAAAVACAIPVPTSVYGTVQGRDDVTILVKASFQGDVAAKAQAAPNALGQYAAVLTTDGIEKLTIAVYAYAGQELLHEKTYNNILPGTKIMLDMEFAPDAVVVQEKTESPSSGGGGGGGAGGGGYPSGIAKVPTIEDIMEDAGSISKDSETEQKTEHSDGEASGQGPLQELPVPQTGSNPREGKPLVLLVALLGALLAVIIILDRKNAKN